MWPSPVRWIIAVSPLALSKILSRLTPIHRLSDHWQDVLTGSILGLVTTYFAYRQYYPSLASEHSHRPYSPRIKRDEDTLPMHRPTPSADVMYSGASGHGASQYHDGSEEEVELVDGTVRRGGPGPLEDVWKDGDERRKPPHDGAI